METSNVCFHCRWSLFWQYDDGFAIGSRNRGCVVVDFWQHNGPQLSLLFIYKLIQASKTCISITFKEARGNGNSPINHSIPWYTKQAFPPGTKITWKKYTSVFLCCSSLYEQLQTYLVILIQQLWRKAKSLLPSLYSSVNFQGAQLKNQCWMFLRRCF